jgi:hypothetical protein
MSALRQPASVEFPGGENWQSLLRDQGYRLFAAGNGSAVIVEGLSLSSLPGPQRLSRPPVPNFDAHYGLRSGAMDVERKFVLLTEVSRASQFSTAANNGGLMARVRQASPWHAVRTIQSLASLTSFVAQRAGRQVFFLVRSARSQDSHGSLRPAALDASAVEIGRSLGLSQPDLEALRVAGLVCEAEKANLQGRGTPAGSAPGCEEAVRSPSCQFPKCANIPAVVLEMKGFCRDHFIAHCYERLDSCAEELRRPTEGDAESEKMRAFLRACAERATELTRAPFHQDPLERARLLDIRYTASDLLRRMRRSPRVAQARPVLLRCETPGRPWQEELRTVLISRFGAMFECRHFVRPEDWLFVERLDTGGRARARMAWRAPAKAGGFSVGLEFMDADNFWGVNWKDFLPAPVQPA